MSIKEQIAELDEDAEDGIRAGLCEAGFDITELKALANSHTRLLEAAKAGRLVAKSSPHWKPPSTKEWTVCEVEGACPVCIGIQALDAAIEEGEKL